MRLAEVLEQRAVFAGGIFLALTRRCPLHCSHCSSSSELASEQYDEAPFRRLVASFRPDDRPAIVAFTGGEALLRPRLVHDLAVDARRVGTRSYLLSGMFFAKTGGALPPALMRAIESVDHLAASIDSFHELEVSRTAVLDTLARRMDAGQDCSLQVTASVPDDPYVTDLAEEVGRRFSGRLPMLVTRLVATGRADRDRLVIRPTRRRSQPVQMSEWVDHVDPCSMAKWPMVGYDGTVLACCQQDLLDRPAPAHLILGHAAEDDWTTLRSRSEGRALLTAIRTYGPSVMARTLAPERPCSGMCESCAELAGAADDPRVLEAVGTPLGRAVTVMVDQSLTDGGADGLLVRFAAREFAHLATSAVGA
jgi:pyruvate-formate lyase-activating enzyme